MKNSVLEEPNTEKLKNASRTAFCIWSWKGCPSGDFEVFSTSYPKRCFLRVFSFPGFWDFPFLKKYWPLIEGAFGFNLWGTLIFSLKWPLRKFLTTVRGRRGWSQRGGTTGWGRRVFPKFQFAFRNPILFGAEIWMWGNEIFGGEGRGGVRDFLKLFYDGIFVSFLRSLNSPPTPTFSSPTKWLTVLLSLLWTWYR